MKHWVSEDIDEEVEAPSESFLGDIEAVCRKHGLSIGHQDGYGAFIIGLFDDGDIEWLRGAQLSGEAYRYLTGGRDGLSVSSL